LFQISLYDNRLSYFRLSLVFMVKKEELSLSCNIVCISHMTLHEEGGWKTGWMDGWMGGWMDGWFYCKRDGHPVTDPVLPSTHFFL
jgi:hypothetical protein